jgi:hypothetical protein
MEQKAETRLGNLAEESVSLYLSLGRGEERYFLQAVRIFPALYAGRILPSGISIYRVPTFSVS